MEKSVITMEQLKADAEQHLLKDGHITPVLFICTGEEAFLVDATEAVKDIEKMVQWTAITAKKKKAYKVFFVSEIWKHELDDQDQNTITKSSEAYQVIEVQQARIDMYIRDFVKEADKIKFVTDGEMTVTPEIHLFEQIQGSLDYLQ